MAILYVLWLLLNLVLTAWMLRGWYSCLKLFAERHNRASAFALGLFTLMTLVNTDAPSDKPSSTERAQPIRFSASVLSVGQPVQHDIQLLNLSFCRLMQRIHITPVQTYANRPALVEITQHVQLLGLQTGLRWQPTGLVISPLPGRRISYTVAGMLNWKLVNMTVYSQPLSYRGTFFVDKPSS